MTKITQLINLMQPYVDDGKLLKRSYEQLNESFEDFVFVTKGDQIVACAALKQYKDEKKGEIYALVVNKEYHNTGASSQLMEKLMNRALTWILLVFLRFLSMVADFFFDTDL